MASTIQNCCLANSSPSRRPHSTKGKGDVIIRATNGAGKTPSAPCCDRAAQMASRRRRHLHPPANNQKMSEGIPLNDADAALGLKPVVIKAISSGSLAAKSSPGVLR